MMHVCHRDAQLPGYKTVIDDSNSRQGVGMPPASKRKRVMIRIIFSLVIGVAALVQPVAAASPVELAQKIENALNRSKRRLVYPSLYASVFWLPLLGQRLTDEFSPRFDATRGGT